MVVRKLGVGNAQGRCVTGREVVHACDNLAAYDCAGNDVDLLVSQGPSRRQGTLKLGRDGKGTLSKDVGLRNQRGMVLLSWR